MHHHMKKLVDLGSVCATSSAELPSSIPYEKPSTENQSSIAEYDGAIDEYSNGESEISFQTITSQPSSNRNQYHSLSESVMLNKKSSYSDLDTKLMKSDNAFNTCESDLTSDSSTPPSPVKITGKYRSCKKTSQYDTKICFNEILTPTTLHSFKIDRDDIDHSVRQLFNRFILDEMEPFRQYFIPIVPFTNNCRMNYQSPQAICVFYGRNKHKESTGDATVRAAYGSIAVISSTGPHPTTGYKVFPFTSVIERMSAAMVELVRRSNKVKTNTKTDFNFLEIKIYLGEDMFEDKDNVTKSEKGKQCLRRDCAKVVNYHNDVRYRDNGLPKNNETVLADHPTVTYSCGSSRQLVFERSTKDPLTDRSWSRIKDCHTFDLEHGSVFVLSPGDEKPTVVANDDSKLHKTQHRVRFAGNGVSIAFVFRCVTKFSKFHPKNHSLLWQYEDDICQRRVKKRSD